MPLILPGNVASATASTTYTVANSCRFNDDDGAYLNKTNGTPTNSKKCTLSMWFKRCELSDSNNFLFGNWTGTSDYAYVRLQADDTIKYTSIVSSSTDADLITTQVFRDCSAWYHIVLALDTEQGTAANRAKLYINGTQVTSFSTEDYPAEDATTQFTENLSSGGFQIGSDKDTGSRYYDGYMAEVVVIDGTQYAASDFGEFDEDSPTIWKPKDVSGLTFGDNGAYLDFEDSDNLGDDESGNTNDWTENNLAATDQAQDSPTNNWCVLNSLLPANDITLSEGNVYAATTTGSWSSESSTFALTAGKWYFEVKVVGYNHNVIGIQNADNASARAGGYPFEIAGAYGFKCYDGSKTSSAADSASYGNAVSNDQIVGCAIDLDNNKIYWSIDNTWQDSGDPESGATGTGSAFDLATGITYVVCNALNHQTGNALSSFNFGCPSHSNSSDAADGNGYGAFEYAPPSGYLALCSKNLGSDGG